MKPYDITFSKRKSIALKITSEGLLKVSAPIGLDPKIVDDWVLKKKPWIEQKTKALSQRAVGFYSGGQEVFVLGKQYEVQVLETAGDAGVFIVGSRCEIRLKRPSIEAARYAMGQYHSQLASQAISKHINYHAPKIGVLPNDIRLKDQKSRWGSCSSKGNLNFNWRLAMADDQVIEYIVVHELCHLVHMNHSQAFWNLVESHLPGYEGHRAWLKTNGHLFF